MQKSREIGGFLYPKIPLYLSILFKPGLLFWGFTSLWWYFSQIVTWKQEITNLWNCSGEIGNRTPGLALAQQARTWPLHHHCSNQPGNIIPLAKIIHVVSPDFGESLRICSKWLQMTALIKDKQRLYQPFYCHKSTYMMKIWSKFNLGVYEIYPSRGVKGGFWVPPPLEVQQFDMYA